MVDPFKGKGQPMNKLDEAKRECKKLEKLKYDGVAGKLPAWVPEPIKKEFEILRLNLFVEAPTNVGASEIIKKYQDYEDMIDGKGCQSLFPPQFHDKFDTLTRIREVVRLGPKKGLSYWVGEKVNEDIQRGKKVKAGGKKGTEAYHGNEKEKKEDRLEYQQAIEKLHAKHPHLSHHKLCETVAQEFKKSTRTIYRYTQNPHKK